MRSLSAQIIVEDILSCVAFFTRVPVAAGTGRPLSQVIWAAPIAGLLVGAIGAGVYVFAISVDLPPQVVAALTLAACMVATGCLHEDGLADVADGFGGGATRERKLEIMKDSRIGTFGVVALVVAILLRWSALAGFGNAFAVAAALLAAHAASRALLPAFMIVVPPARRAGLAAGAGTVTFGSAMVALLLAAASLLLLGLVPAILSVLLLAGWFAALRALTVRQIGGQTGDVLGTLQQGAEILVLLTAAVFAHQM